MTRNRKPIDWETCDPSLIERHEEVLAGLIKKQLVIDGESPSQITLRALDEEAARLVQEEVDDDRELAEEDEAADAELWQ